jgi:hypothetical protein
MVYNASMHIRTRRWSFTAWIACLAILFNAFVPILSYAVEARSAAPAAMEMEVCTALGMQMMPVASEDADSGQLHKNMNHCGYCAAHAATHGLPPPMTVAFAPLSGRDVYPPLYYLSARPLFPWSLAQPRAPPRLA